MKRFHVHMTVDDLGKHLAFYNHLFGQPPTVEKGDYAKWLLDDPMVNFAISTRGKTMGVNHFGFQAADKAELSELRQRADSAAGDAILDEGETACCYAKSDKHWVADPSGMAWEHYHTMADVQSYGLSDEAVCRLPEEEAEQSACCVPDEVVKQVSCCVPDTKPEQSSCCG